MLASVGLAGGCLLTANFGADALAAGGPLTPTPSAATPRPAPRPALVARTASRSERRSALALPTRLERQLLPVGASFSGLASWYGPGFDGRRTASGEVFHQDALTAASRTLPLGSLLKVCHDGVCVVVVVNDRGPAPLSRVLDLSRGAAAAIGVLAEGLGEVSATPVAYELVPVAVPAGPGTLGMVRRLTG